MTPKTRSGERDPELRAKMRAAKDQANQMREKTTKWVCALIDEQTADVQEFVTGVGQLRRGTGEERNEERESHLRALARVIDLRETAICSALRLREQAVIAGSADPDARGKSAAILGKIAPRPISLPDADSTSTSKGNASGLG